MRPIAAALALSLLSGLAAGDPGSGDLVDLPVRPLAGRRHLMGFALDDEAYLERIPTAARRVPRALLDGRIFFASDEDHRRQLADPRAVTSAPGVLTFRAYETSPDGEYIVRKVMHRAAGAYDHWYLLDVPRNIRGVIAVERETRRTYYFQVEGFATPEGAGKSHYLVGDEPCYACHPSGLRAILPRDDDPEVDRDLLEHLNERILETGVADHGDDVDWRAQGASVERCSGCHDGETRGRLYPGHFAPIRYKLRTLRAMPPDEPLGEAEAETLLDDIRRERAALAGVAELCPEATLHLALLRGQAPAPETFDAKIRACWEKATAEAALCVVTASDPVDAECCFPH